MEVNMESLEIIGQNAKKAAGMLAKLGTTAKNDILKSVAKQLLSKKDYILAQNAKDVSNAEANGMQPALVDRLMLNDARISSMAEEIGRASCRERVS